MIQAVKWGIPQLSSGCLVHQAVLRLRVQGSLLPACLLLLLLAEMTCSEASPDSSIAEVLCLQVERNCQGGKPSHP